MNKLTRRNFLKAFAVVAVAGPAVAVAKPPVQIVTELPSSTFGKVICISTPDGSELQSWQKRFIRTLCNYEKEKGWSARFQESDDMVTWVDSLIEVRKVPT